MTFSLVGAEKTGELVMSLRCRTSVKVVGRLIYAGHLDSPIRCTHLDMAPFDIKTERI